MRRILCFISVAILCISCGRAAGDDTVQVNCALRNMSSSDIFAETNFPMKLSSDSKFNSGVIHNTESLWLFDDEMRRIGSYDDFVTELLRYNPDAEVRIYSVNEDGSKGDLLFSCPMKDFPGETWNDSYRQSHFRIKTNDYPFFIHLGAMWDGNRLQGRVEN